jgi:hypothetical protein
MSANPKPRSSGRGVVFLMVKKYSGEEFCWPFLATLLMNTILKNFKMSKDIERF